MKVKRRLLKKSLQEKVASLFGYKPFLWRPLKITLNETMEAIVTGKLTLNYRIDQGTHKGVVKQTISTPADTKTYFNDLAGEIIKNSITPNDEIVLETIRNNPDSIYGDGVFDLLRNSPKYSLFSHTDCSLCNGAGKCTCPNCHGSRTNLCHSCHGSKTHKCSTCYGYGTVEVPYGQQTSAGYIQGTKIYSCADCRGSGNVACGGCSGRGYYDCSCTQGKVTCYNCDGTGALSTEQYLVVSAHLDREMEYTPGSRTITGQFNKYTATRFFPDAHPPQWNNDDHTEIQIKLTGPRINTILKTSSSEHPAYFCGKDLSIALAPLYTKHLFAKHLSKLKGFFIKLKLSKVEKMPFVREMIQEHESGIVIPNLKAVGNCITAEQAAEFFAIRRKVRGPSRA